MIITVVPKRRRRRRGARARVVGTDRSIGRREDCRRVWPRTRTTGVAVSDVLDADTSTTQSFLVT